MPASTFWQNSDVVSSHHMPLLGFLISALAFRMILFAVSNFPRVNPYTEQCTRQY